MRRQTAEFMRGESREAFLRRAIDDAGLTLKDFSSKAGIPVTSLGTILKRGIGTTSIDTALKICDALEIDLETLARAEYHSGSSEADIFIIDVAERLQRARFILRYRAVVLAEMLDISIEQYRRFESAHYMVPTRYLRMLSKIMNVPYEYLIGKQEPDPNWKTISCESPEEFEAYDLGKAIFSIRTECNLSQEELASQLGVSTSQIQKWESRICVPTVFDLTSLCNIFSRSGKEVNLFTFRAYLAQPETLQLSNEERSLIFRYRNSNEKERRIVEAALDIEHI